MVAAAHSLRSLNSLKAGDTHWETNPQIFAGRMWAEYVLVPPKNILIISAGEKMTRHLTQLAVLWNKRLPWMCAELCGGAVSFEVQSGALCSSVLLLSTATLCQLTHKESIWFFWSPPIEADGFHPARLFIRRRTTCYSRTGVLKIPLRTCVIAGSPLVGTCAQSDSRLSLSFEKVTSAGRRQETIIKCFQKWLNR